MAGMKNCRLPVIKCLVTRPKELVSGMAKKLREQGAEVLELPAIGVKPVEDRTNHLQGI